MKFLKKLLVVLLILIVVNLPAHAGSNPYFKASDKNFLTVSYIDAGQGDATLIECPNGITILIDGGCGRSRYYPVDAGRKKVLPFLKAKGIKKLNFVIMTHPDFDHIGGLDSVLREFPVEYLLDSGYPRVIDFYENILKLADEKNIKYRMIKAGDELDVNDYRITIEILAPDMVRTELDTNDNSIAVKLGFGEVSFLFTGDAALTEEKYLADTYGKALRSKIYKVGHHGSEYSTNGFFIKKVAPEAAIISCGLRNRYGHPSDRVIDLLTDMGVDIYNTSVDGNIMVLTDGISYKIFTGSSIFDKNNFNLLAAKDSGKAKTIIP